jgi:hypothetical protein
VTTEIKRFVELAEADCVALNFILEDVRVLPGEPIGG